MKKKYFVPVLATYVAENGYICNIQLGSEYDGGDIDARRRNGFADEVSVKET